ncbi:rodlin [Streptomyces boluensis]|uniref:RdlA protein n=1 Tax=Streptomyces boluensis TaxID=1775135 RepID=A0A964XP30_9ACTN|nr:rodlin [Streptomyces boluensis]NBE54801.1 RdlA protein [Streptomyces boluensis]
MIKKILATAAVTASVLGTGAAMAPSAIADDGDNTVSESGNNASQVYGNSATHGDMSPQMALIQGSLNKPCVGLPAKLNAGSIVGVVPVSVQDIPVLSNPQNQQCTENSTQAKGDEPLSNLLQNVPILSAN